LTTSAAHISPFGPPNTKGRWSAPGIYIFLVVNVVFSLIKRFLFVFGPDLMHRQDRAPPIAAAVLTPLGTVEAGDEVD
jgi:hypothetical protein